MTESLSKRVEGVQLDADLVGTGLGNPVLLGSAVATPKAKATVEALQSTVQERDKEIEGLKQELAHASTHGHEHMRTYTYMWRYDCVFADAYTDTFIYSSLTYLEHSTLSR